MPGQAERAARELLPQGQPDRAARARAAPHRRPGRGRRRRRTASTSSIGRVWKTEAALLVLRRAGAGAEHIVRSAARAGAAARRVEWNAVYVETPALQRLPDGAARAHPARAEARRGARRDDGDRSPGHDVATRRRRLCAATRTSRRSWWATTGEPLALRRRTLAQQLGTAGARRRPDRDRRAREPDARPRRRRGAPRPARAGREAAGATLVAVAACALPRRRRAARRAARPGQHRDAVPARGGRAWRCAAGAARRSLAAVLNVARLRLLLRAAALLVRRRATPVPAHLRRDARRRPDRRPAHRRAALPGARRPAPRAARAALFEFARDLVQHARPPTQVVETAADCGRARVPARRRSSSCSTPTSSSARSSPRAKAPGLDAGTAAHGPSTTPARRPGHRHAAGQRLACSCRSRRRCAPAACWRSRPRSARADLWCRSNAASSRPSPRSPPSRSSACTTSKWRSRRLVQIESERLRNSLLAALSHDLRTPLAGLVGLADTLRLDPAAA